MVLAGCGVVGMEAVGAVLSGSSAGLSSVLSKEDTSRESAFLRCLFVLGGISSDYILIS